MVGVKCHRSGRKARARKDTKTRRRLRMFGRSEEVELSCLGCWLDTSTAAERFGLGLM